MSQSAMHALLQRCQPLLSAPDAFRDEIHRSVEWLDLSPAEQAAVNALDLDGLATFLAAGSGRREGTARSLNIA